MRLHLGVAPWGFLTSCNMFGDAIYALFEFSVLRADRPLIEIRVFKAPHDDALEGLSATTMVRTRKRKLTWVKGRKAHRP